MSGIRAVEAHGGPTVLRHDWLDARQERPAKTRKSGEPTESLIGGWHPRDFSPGGFHPKPFGPDAQGTPDEGVEGHDDRGEDSDSNRDAGVVTDEPRIRDEGAKSGSGVCPPEGGERLAGDEEEPAVAPRQNRVVHEFRDRRGKREETKSEHSAEAEARRRGLEVHGDGRQRFVDPERHVPSHARENQEHDREFDPSWAALERRDEEHERGREKAKVGTERRAMENRKQDKGAFLVV